ANASHCAPKAARPMIRNVFAYLLPPTCRALGGHLSKRYGKAIPAVDRHDQQGQLHEFLLTEMGPYRVPHLVGYPTLGHQCKRLGTLQRCPLPIRKKGRFAPRHQRVQAPVGFPAYARIACLHIGAKGAAVDLRGTQYDQLVQWFLDTGLFYNVFQSHHRLIYRRTDFEKIQTLLHVALLIEKAPTWMSNRQRSV